MVSLGWRDEPLLLAGPGTRYAQVAPTGLEVHLHLEATFDAFVGPDWFDTGRERDDGGDVPGLGVLGAVLAMALARRLRGRA